MNIQYIAFTEQEELKRSYQIKDNDKEIGSVEGYLIEYGVLVTVVKIFNPNYKKKGLGFAAFKKVFDELNGFISIKRIRGCWCSGGEFQDFENGMSTNLKVFTENLENGKDEQDCAFLTPTGKWAKKLGYSKCNIMSKSISEVTVDFENDNNRQQKHPDTMCG